jgi:hypothetical protein
MSTGYCLFLLCDTADYLCGHQGYHLQKTRSHREATLTRRTLSRLLKVRLPTLLRTFAASDENIPLATFEKELYQRKTSPPPRVALLLVTMRRILRPNVRGFESSPGAHYC